MNRPSPHPRPPWFAYVWPGLAQLWYGGSLAGLALALGFAVLLNLAILGIFVWPELFPTNALRIGCGALTLLWAAALWQTRREFRLQSALQDDDSPEKLAEKQAQEEVERMLIAAQTSYLAGDWTTTEDLLLDALRIDRDDIECQLLLATLWKHTKRTKESSSRLRRLSKLDAAAPWQFEIERELAAIAIANATSAHDPTIDVSDDQTETSTTGKAA